MFKGYKYEYIRELISPDDQVVNSGIITQAPGYLGTSTIVAIGGRGLVAGTYTVRIRAENGEEDQISIIVPDYETYLKKIKQDEKLRLQRDRITDR